MSRQHCYQTFASNHKILALFTMLQELHYKDKFHGWSSNHPELTTTTPCDRGQQPWPQLWPETMPLDCGPLACDNGPRPRPSHVAAARDRGPWSWPAIIDPLDLCPRLWPMTMAQIPASPRTMSGLWHESSRFLLCLAVLDISQPSLLISSEICKMINLIENHLSKNSLSDQPGMKILS